jgi:hypothetical protein
MFCALNGATLIPRLWSDRQIAVAIQLLPTCDAVPATINARAGTPLNPAVPAVKHQHGTTVLSG